MNENAEQMDLLRRLFTFVTEQACNPDQCSGKLENGDRVFGVVLYFRDSLKKDLFWKLCYDLYPNRKVFD